MAHFLNIDTANNANAQQWFPILSPSTLDSGLFTVSSSPVSMHDASVYIANDYSSIIGNGYPQYTTNNDFDINALRGSRLPTQESACLPTSTLFEFDFNNQFSFLPPSPESPSTSLTSQTSSPAFENDQNPSMHSSNSAASGIINTSGLLGFGPPASFDIPVSAVSANTSPVPGDAALYRKPAKRASTSASSASSSSSMPESPSAMSMVPSKKPRSSMSAKDFIPPDVTGLSKREARLVKNRAAAFLSRQRKREEFECMEIRVAELERENSRLQALLSSSSQDASPTSTSASSVATLRAQLTASQQREHELVAQINRLHTSLSSSTPPSSSSGSQSPNSPSFSSSSSSQSSTHYIQQSSVWNHEDHYEPEPELDCSTSSSSEASTPLMNGFNALNY